ncbi:ferric-dicitrate binding protein FerR (iron transport regulator) [Pedobacter sp. AK017]|uniref:FecR family protein n=1 Tax=Pedobacter sp. AK017 TaxID=2723073 RepID=UPI001611C1A5|nr:FecR domain-containing protein [Pedobacter sp. AK017]MBB5439572.1 ferric-dicitrate binding protein FerR (iron transport regulator) [Pedobacter sp. AK017]
MMKQYFLKLLSKRLSGEISPEEDVKLQEAIEQEPDFKQTATALTRYFENKNVSARNSVYTVDKLIKTRDRIVLAENQGFVPKYNHSEVIKRGFSGLSLLKIAAIFLVLLGSTFITYHFLNRTQPLKFDTLNTTADKVFKTLDDGTKVYLNRGSSIRYNQGFGKEKREIFLDGEAFFDVAKNKAIPLFIHVRNLNIEVKGTAFNVNADQKKHSVEISLLRGLIEITSILDKDSRVLLKPNEKLIAAAQLSPAGTGFKVISMAAEKQLQEIKWTQDSLMFKKEKLKDLVLRLEKKYDVKIEIRKEELKDKRFSGAFAAEGLKEALEALKLSYPFTYIISDKLVILK